VPDNTVTVGGEYTGTFGFATTVDVCLKSPNTGDPILDQSYLAGKCDGVCGSRLARSQGAIVVGYCVDGEPAGSTQQFLTSSPVQAPISTEHHINSGSTITLSRDGQAGLSNVAGTMNLINE